MQGSASSRTLRMLICILAVPAALPLVGASAEGADEKPPPPTASIRVAHDRVDPEDDLPRSVFVTLYRDGKAIRTSELWINGPLGVDVEWTRLPLGAYEVHMEARGYRKTVKRVILSEDDLEFPLVVHTELDRKRPLQFGPRGR